MDFFFFFCSKDIQRKSEKTPKFDSREVWKGLDGSAKNLRMVWILQTRSGCWDADFARIDVVYRGNLKKKFKYSFFSGLLIFFLPIINFYKFFKSWRSELKFFF